MTNQVSKGRGVLGTVEAFGKPDEEQGRGTYTLTGKSGSRK